jgi:hypothetical protein
MADDKEDQEQTGGGDNLFLADGGLQIMAGGNRHKIMVNCEISAGL